FCAITSKRIYRPFYFDYNKGNAVTVNKENYRYTLEHSVIPTIGNVDEMWYQQDGAPPHIAHKTITFLKAIFGNRIISKNGNINWPARSPDLSPLDFSLWGYLKDRVYRNKLETIEDLKENIETEIADIPRCMLKKVMNSFYDRVQQCRQKEGRLLDDVIFHT
uniref:Tc1-like transposase DDE domain-containing protein n=1 Tax=Strongyloides stercoralis TaxID=6248 RepID=A0AAF5DTE4_STRER